MSVNPISGYPINYPKPVSQNGESVEALDSTILSPDPNRLAAVKNLGQYGLYDVTEFTPMMDEIRAWSIANYREPDPNVIDNSEYAKSSMFRIYQHYDENKKPITTSLWADTAWRSGQAIHGFCYIDTETDFLLEAAQQYAKLEDGQSYLHRAIYDSDFINIVTNFFTGSDPTQEEQEFIKSQMDTVVKELANRIKNGESTDIRTLESTITIAGKDVTIGQLLDISTVARDLTAFMNSVSSQPGVHAYAEYGLAVSMAGLYGQMSDNPLAGLLESAVDRVATRAVDITFNSDLKGMPQYPYIATTGIKIYEMFKNIDMGDSENAIKQLQQTLDQYRTLRNSTSGLTTPEGTANSIKYLAQRFDKWMGTICP